MNLIFQKRRGFSTLLLIVEVTILNYYKYECAGINIYYRFNYDETKQLFHSYINGPYSDANGITISLTEQYLDENRWLISEKEKSNAFLEYKCLMLATGNALLEYNRAVFHSVAVLWKKYAWIITAPSGTGKTTQIRHWKKILGKNAVIINGDKPIIEICSNNSVWVYSSPWRGKEHAGSPGLKAPLGGIVLLQQGNSNEIQRMSESDAVIPLFSEFISYPENSLQIQKQAEILEHILQAVPVWKLVNVGDLDSAQLTIETIQHYMEVTNG